jgi:hypothetical protein
VSTCKAFYKNGDARNGTNDELLLAMREDRKADKEEMLAKMDANQKEAEAM